MKKLALSALTLGGILLASCGSSTPKYVVTAQAPEGVTDSTMVYLQLLSGDKIDSTLVLNGQIKFENNFEKSGLVQVGLDRKSVVRFVLEPTTIALDFATKTATGGELNATRAANKVKQEALMAKVQEAYKAANDQLATAADDDAKKAIQTAFQEKYQNEFMPQIEELNMEIFNANKNNPLGVEALLDMVSNGADEAKQQSLIDQLGPDMASDFNVVKLQSQLNVIKKTGEGQMFTDFTIDQGDGTTVSLSDYVGKGKYVLVDFWASWCPPCRAEIPNLAKVYEQYKGDNFELLSVAVWDKIDDSKRGIEELNMTWPQIINGQSIPTELYGIKGIPQIILFGPDGTIIKRNLRGEEIGKTLAELIK